MAPSGNSAGKRKADASPDGRRQVKHPNAGVINRVQREHWKHLDSPSPSPPTSPRPAIAESAQRVTDARHLVAGAGGHVVDPISSRRSAGKSLSKRSSGLAAVGESVSRGVAVTPHSDRTDVSSSSVASLPRNTTPAKRTPTTAEKSERPAKDVFSKHVPSPLKIGHVVWIPWHDGCLYSATVTKVLPDQFFEFRYKSTNIAICLALKDVRPNFHDKRFFTSGVDNFSDAGLWHFGKLVLAYSTSVEAYIPGRITRFHKAGHHAGKRQPTRVEISFLHTSAITETVHCCKLKAMEPSTPTKLAADGSALYPLPYQMHHPGYANLRVLSIPQPTRDSAEHRIGDLVIAPWPTSNQYHLGVIVLDSICPDGSGVPVLFFQDPKRKCIRHNIVARISEKLVIDAPDLPSPPADGQQGSYGIPQYQWLHKHAWEDAELQLEQLVAVRVVRSGKDELRGFHVLGRLCSQDANGFHVDLLGEHVPKRSVTVSRGLIRPLYRGDAMVYKKTKESVWPEVPAVSTSAVVRPHKGTSQQSVLGRTPQGRTQTVKTNRGFRTSAGWKSILELAMFDKVSDDNPVVNACASDRTPGTMDASSGTSLFVWTAKPGPISHLCSAIIVRLHGDVTVSWNFSGSQGIEAIQVGVRGDGHCMTFKISMNDKKAAYRVMKNLKMKLQRARQQQPLTGHGTSWTDAQLIED
ncbi:hypothetical protein LTR56_018246 [Elasticomyces elasticus]|nr:hypothetical protein LTR56_018246 [Elasticomyces elasticus]KAK3658587.1 hypothetical protein LTR22_008940 [Elasticomyces elasticus]KAK4906786.1 hypothetical protein LTR49_024114 [Elasticomyces elasticus]KAK5766961.1 hypothetical protein LTS12_002725 [Elasticomyces elasticus]